MGYKIKDKMFNSQKNVFWQAFILATFVFAAGILLGFVLENWRFGKIESLYFQSELDLLDIRIQNDIYSLAKIDCEKAIGENINFANKIYDEANLLQRYEDANKITENIILQHRKYDLLRTLFWINAIKIKSRCNATYHNLVYLYKYNNPSLEIKAKQLVFSRILSELKEDRGDEIMLIPIAGDNNLASVGLLMGLYNITEAELPVILIDEKIKINDIEKKSDIDKLIG